MKKILYIAISILLIGAIGYLILNKSNTTNPVVKTPEIIEQIVNNNGQLIDVRTVEEYVASHADDAVNVPLDDILNGSFDKIDKTRPVYVYCRSGNRSAQAKVALEKVGYTNIVDLGGLSFLQADGVVVCSTNEPSC